MLNNMDISAIRHPLKTLFGTISYYRLESLIEQKPTLDLHQLPFSIRILLESALRNYNAVSITEKDIEQLMNWSAQSESQHEIPFMPARVILQDFTGVPLLVDLAAMRSAMKKIGGDPKKINPQVPVDLVIDHSIQVDYYGTAQSFIKNAKIELFRNKERYEFLKWGQNVIDKFRVIPPSTGIVHQVNLEYLAQGVLLNSDVQKDVKELIAYPDTLVGTDSHTTMINGLGILGWGVGGIEAEAVMLGQPLFLLSPKVLGFKLTGCLMEGVTATDLTLTITKILRKKGVVDKFVEFYGAGLSELSLADRATIANMAPEYGATLSFFPFDQISIDYLKQTGRSAARVDLCERYYKEQNLFRYDGMPDPKFSEVVELDLSTIEPSIAGPKRPQDLVPLKSSKTIFQKSLTAPLKEQGFALAENELNHVASVKIGNEDEQLRQGSIVIAAITSCTNTSNPSVMVAAGLLAKKAVEAGLKVPSYVKTSLAPGSKVVTHYLKESKLIEYLEQLGFYLVGYGCTTCIGNSGPLKEEVETAINSENLVVAAILSGNRNFEGRIHPAVRANYLASPPLVVAYALAGTINKDLLTEPLGMNNKQEPVYLKDIWPKQDEIIEIIRKTISSDMFVQAYEQVYQGDDDWNLINGGFSDIYSFSDSSTYIQEPPFFQNFSVYPEQIKPIHKAKALCVLGDSITTDHISPAGSIAGNSPAGIYLKNNGIQKADFNSYGARRGNDRVMVRGTFANVRLKNLMTPLTEGGYTIHVPTKEQVTIFEAAERYKKEETPLIIIAGKEYGSGSSRDWAAKGTLLLGVRAVLAESFERIHRSNLVGMGILPLSFCVGDTAERLGLNGLETYTILIPKKLAPKIEIPIQVDRQDGSQITFNATCRLDSFVEIEYFQNGGILHYVLRSLIKKVG